MAARITSNDSLITVDLQQSAADTVSNDDTDGKEENSKSRGASDDGEDKFERNGEGSSEIHKENENINCDEIFSESKQNVRYFVLFVKLLVFLLVLATLVASKISIATMIGHLHSMTPFGNHPAINTTDDRDMKTAIRLYWQLLLILAIPNLITWVRSLFNGVIGKSASQPRPKFWSIVGVSIIHVLFMLNILLLV